MKKELLFELQTPYRDPFQIYGFRFGAGKKSAAIVGAMRGDEIQQQFICSQLVKNFTRIEQAGEISPDCEIIVIPSANHFSMNLNKRFWAMDGTDINRMFPGYEKGETTQRIAAALFSTLNGYQYGIHLASFYLQGEFIPHARVMDAGYSDPEIARQFGLPYVMLRKPSAFDTTVLNYNWQVFGTQSFSVYSSNTATIDIDSARLAWQAILRFLDTRQIIRYRTHRGFKSEIIEEQKLAPVKSPRGGILCAKVRANQEVREDDLLAEISDPYNGSLIGEVRAPVSGIIFFAHFSPLVNQNTVIYKIVPY